jgi:hypothetical protein
MRTAEEILKSNDVAIDRWPDTKALIIKSINEARKEAIEECAKNVSMRQFRSIPCETESERLNKEIQIKQSILSLINELK